MNENVATWLDREGIFKLKPFMWKVDPSTKSKSVAVTIRFLVVAVLENNAWTDWSDYDPIQAQGQWWVVGKEGGVNQTAVDQLSGCLGWDGSLKTVRLTNPPDVVVQGTVTKETFAGTSGPVTRFKVGWLNPEDFVPEFGASEQEVTDMDVQFGSLLRAAASVKKPAKSLPPPTPKEIPVAAGADDDVPF